MLLYLQLSALLNFLVSFFLGFFVFFKNPKKRINQSLSLLCLAASVWAFFYLLWQFEARDYLALLWTRLLMLGAIWVPSTYLRVVVDFLDIQKSARAFLYTSYLLATVFSILTVTPLMVSHVEPIDFVKFWPKPGEIYFLFLIFFISFSLYGAYLSYRALSYVSSQKKSQITYMLLGIFLSIIGGSTNYFLWYGIPIRPYGNILASTFVFLTVFAIMKHRLLDIKVVARRYAVYIASVVTIVIPAVAVQIFLKPYVGTYGWLVDIAILLAAISVFMPLKKYYYDFANHYLFSSLYDSRKVIRELSDKLRSTIKAEEVYHFISQTLTNAFHTRGIAILTYDEKKNVFFLMYQRDFEKCSKELTISKNLSSYLLRTDEPLLLNDLPDGVIKKAELDSLHSCGVAIMNPLNLKEKLIGIMLLSEKESNEVYNEEDIQVLNVVGTQAAIAIENAMLYEEARKFNITLQKKVAGATHKLKLQNEELQKLDNMKSEFISIASHQLRTPLTATKWALEFLAKGKKGKLTAQEKETIGDLRTSNERLIKLVNELLNVSRLEESRVRIEPKPTDLIVLLKALVHEFMPIAEKMNQRVVEAYDTLPLINLDESIITKALHNFISNGIKYNKDGGKFVITAKKKDKEAVLTFQDHGIGIPKAEQSNIFKKFYRASNASASHTEGTGLGMYIAKSAIELSGGKVWFESTEGKGTTFTVTLPFSGSRAREGEKSLS